MTKNLPKDYVILVEPSATQGFEHVGVISWVKEKLAKKSEESIDNAMKTIEVMTSKVQSSIKNINQTNKPKQVDVEFGIKFDGELDVIIAKVGTEASITVKLHWDL
jgi:hypothetical protein